MSKENEQFLSYIGRKYRECATIECYRGNELRERSSIEDKVEFMFYVESILKMMPQDYALIIRNDFLKKRNEKWWQAYFTKSTYYRKKNRAVDEFVSCVNR